MWTARDAHLTVNSFATKGRGKLEVRWFAVIRRRATGHPVLIGSLIRLVWTNAPTVTDRFAPNSRLIVAASLLVGIGSGVQECPQISRWHCVALALELRGP